MYSETVTVTLIVTRIFEALGIRYAIGGSVASAAYGQIRATLDVDIVADMQSEHVDPFIEALGDAFYADRNMIHTAVMRRDSFNLIHFETMFKVDVFVAKNRPFDEQQLTRRKLQTLAKPDAKAYVVSAEDILLAKLLWYRMGGEVSERQWRDILSILQVQGDALDWGYVVESAEKNSVTDLLHRAQDEFESDRDRNRGSLS